MRRRSFVLFSAFLIIFASASGCQPADEPAVQSVVPPIAQARLALESALTAWTQRQATPALDGVRVEQMDRDRRDGRRLASFEILGSTRDDRARGFVVRLTWETPPPNGSKTETVQYLVAGIDPLWVMRQDEIELLLHWEHAMDADAVKKAEPPGDNDSGADSKDQ